MEAMVQPGLRLIRQMGSVKGSDISNSRILIIDDHLLNVELIEKMLRYAGYRNLRSTCDSREAVPLFENFHPDLAIVDLMMPHIDGYALLTQFACLTAPGAYVPTLVLTADPASEAKQKALALGAQDFLTKPFDATELLLCVRNLLHTRSLHVHLQGQNRVLDERVRERTREVEESRIEILLRLAVAREPHTAEEIVFA